MVPSNGTLCSSFATPSPLRQRGCSFSPEPVAGGCQLAVLHCLTTRKPPPPRPPSGLGIDPVGIVMIIAIMNTSPPTHYACSPRSHSTRLGADKRLSCLVSFYSFSPDRTVPLISSLPVPRASRARFITLDLASATARRSYLESRIPHLFRPHR